MAMSYEEYCDATIALSEWFKSQQIDSTDACVMMAALTATIIKMSVSPEFHEDVMGKFTEMVVIGMRGPKQ